MSARFSKVTGAWVELRAPNQAELDLHLKPEVQGEHGSRHQSFEQNMQDAYDLTLQALKDAVEESQDSLLVVHGKSTSGIGRRSSRSVVRALMRSKEATPYIVRTKSLEHETAFLACLRPKSQRPDS